MTDPARPRSGRRRTLVTIIVPLALSLVVLTLAVPQALSAGVSPTRGTPTTGSPTPAVPTGTPVAQPSARPAHRPPAIPGPATYYPYGPQTNVDESVVTGGGWTLCWMGTYVDRPVIADLLAQCPGSYMLLAGGPVGSTVYDVLAAAPRADVLFDTGRECCTPHDANGSSWYFNDSFSWGFARQGDPVHRQSCDAYDWFQDKDALPTTGPYRLCWHTGGGSLGVGWRSGINVWLNDSTTFRRAIYTSGYSLSVTLDGNGTGWVMSDPTGIHCGNVCTWGFDDGSTVTLSATPNAANSAFAGWSGGDCSGIGTCEVTVDENTQVTATFVRNSFELRISDIGTGSGIVGSDPAGVCGDGCAASFPAGSTLILTATASPGSRFDSWGGDCVGATPFCSVIMDQDRTVVTSFVGLRTLRVVRAGKGSGEVTSDPAGISCGIVCSGIFDRGSLVYLTATPSPGSRFVGWGGPCLTSGSRRSCLVRLDTSRKITAYFKSG